jgi:PAS domain S-box-containing protein
MTMLAVTASQLLLNDVSDGACLVDAEDHIVVANRRLIELLELPAGFLRAGDPIDKLCDFLRERGEYRAAEESGRLTTMFRNAHRMSFVTAQERTNGQIIEIRSRPQATGGFIVTLADVTERRRAADALRLSQERLRDTFTLAPVGIAICDLSNRFLETNEAYCHITGYSQEELRQRDFYSITHPDDLTATAASVERLIKDKLPGFIMDKRYVRRDGGIAWVRVSVSLVRDGDGRPLHLFAYIIPQQEAEQTRCETETSYRNVFDNTSDCAFLIDVTADRRFRIAEYNPAQARSMGLRNSEVAGRYLDEALPPHVAKAVSANYRRCLQGGETISYEEVLDLPAGQASFRTRLTPLRNAAGDICRLIGIAHDITEQEQAARALRESEARFRRLASSLPGVIYSSILSPDGVIRHPYVSPGIKQMLGVEPEELMSGSRTLLDFAHPDDRASKLQALQESAITLKPVTLELRMNPREDPTSRWWQITTTPTRLSDGSVQFDGIALDVTDRKAAEDQLRQAMKMESVGQLTGGLAHDFNNLLTVMLGSAELLEERVPPEDASALHFLNNILVAGRQGADLTQRLLAFARRQPLDPRQIDIDKLVVELIPLLSRSLGEDVDILPIFRSERSTVNVDANQLESAILNLAVNARDAMPDGGRLVIETSNVVIDKPWADRYGGMAPGPYVLISVSDEGTGMPPEVAARAVEPFFTTKPTGKGTGLGLSMVYGFVKQSGGHMTIYSEIGHGTTINIYLTEVRGDKPAPPVPEDVAPIPRGSEAILYVEDDAVVREIVVKMLSMLGYRVTTASNGPEAIEILESPQPMDLLFTDVVLPGGIGGRQVAEAAQRLRPTLRVLFTSGYTESAILHHGRLDPGVRLLNKPFQMRELAETVRQTLDG